MIICKFCPVIPIDGADMSKDDRIIGIRGRLGVGQVYISVKVGLQAQ